jgi:hypothetical protein
MKLKLSVLLLSSLLALSCKKQDAGKPIVPYDLIVEGGITTYSVNQYIRLTKPVLSAGSQIQPINGAIVTVNDGETDVPFKEIKKTGVYTAVMKNNKNYNEAYTLKITYDQKQYEATDTLFQVFPISDRYIPLSIKVNVSDVKITVPKHTFGAFFAQQWLITQGKGTWGPGKFEENYQYSYSHQYGSPDALNPLLPQNFILTATITDKLTIYKFSLSRSHTAFLYNVFQETDWRGILSSVPGNIKGNISGNASGFFFTTDVEMQKKSIVELIKQNQ